MVDNASRGQALDTNSRGHGSPYDRGAADSHYQRGPVPHWYPEGTYNGKRVEESEMTKEQIREYMIGFAENEAALDFKDW